LERKARDSSKMLSHFLRAWADSRMKFNVLREDGAGETPQALKRRGGSPNRPKVREVPGAEINGQVISRALLKKEPNEAFAIR
jgi:hypothetical protein